MNSKGNDFNAFIVGIAYTVIMVVCLLNVELTGLLDIVLYVLIIIFVDVMCGMVFILEHFQS